MYTVHSGIDINFSSLFYKYLIKLIASTNTKCMYRYNVQRKQINMEYYKLRTSNISHKSNHIQHTRNIVNFPIDISISFGLFT